MQLDHLPERVWLKGHSITDTNELGHLKWPPGVWRRDDYGTPMFHDDYGNRDSKHGWEVDHIKPVADGGSDSIGNLRPLNWRNNVERN